MRKTENRRKKIQMPAGIRQKMMAAVSMLMVSAVMLVSSTYAWFTLSTAPEVAGITTNIGSNGNLEMLLLSGELDEALQTTGSYYSSADDLGVISTEGQSMASRNAVEANEFWGNLVDLSDISYGLGNITLAPSRLNLTKQVTGETTLGQTILKAPTYGSDGRVIDVNTDTYTGKFNGTSFAYDEANKGVRVIGTTTDVSQRLAAYRTARTNVSTNISAAKSLATKSLMDNGQSLADILVGYVANANQKYNNDDLDVLNSVLTSLQNANTSIVDAIKNAVYAYSLSGSNTAELSDEAVKTLQEEINAVVVTSTTSFDSVANVVVPTGVSAAISAYLTTNTKLSNAITKYTNLRTENGEYTYAQISPILNDIVDKTYVEIAGKQNLGSEDLNLVIEEFTNKGSISMTMLSGSGVYADIAELVGTYTVSGLKVHVEYNGITADVPVVMSTKIGSADGSSNPLPYVPNITLGTAPEDSGQAANSILSNTYGYALDFGFRTNAASSNLLLQTAAANRVYSDSEESSIQGGGSYMQFVSGEANFTAQDVLNLMSAIRIAFVDVTDSELLAVAALDINRDFTDGKWACTPGNSTVKIKLDGTVISGEETPGEEGAAGYKAGLFLYEHTVNEDGTITLGAQKTDKSEITALTQNKASKITTVLYLDGDIVDNTMVANNGVSLTGKLNLQFSSSATLTPMENTGMREGGATATPTSYTKVAESGQTYSYGGYSGTVKSGYTIYDGGNGAYYFSTDAETYIRLTVSNFTTPFENIVMPSVPAPAEPSPEPTE